MELIFDHLAPIVGVDAVQLEKFFSLLGVIGAFLLTPFGLLVALWQYKIRRFSDHVVFAGNYFEPDADDVLKLRLRNAGMLPIDDVLPTNPLFRWRLALAIRRCTADDPFIKMSPADMDVLQPAMVSALCNTQGQSTLAYLKGDAVRSEKLQMAVTFEKDGAVKSQKIRLMLASDPVLARFDDPDFVQSVSFERSHHRYRLRTLQLMRSLQKKEKVLRVGSVRIVRPFFALF